MTPTDNSTAADFPPSGDSVPENEIELEKTRLLFRNAGIAQLVSVVNSSVLVFILDGLSPRLWAIGWWLLAIAVAAARYGLARRFERSRPAPADASRWRRQALAGALVAGLLWAGGGAAIMVADPDSARLFAALVMAGMVAGAVPVLSSVPAAFRAYSVPVVLSAIATVVIDGHGRRDWMLAVVASIFFLAMLKSARYFHDSLDNSIRLAFSMRRMAEQLELARQGAEAASTAKSRFLAAMSHEIRTPLNGVLGMAQLLLMPGLNDTERRDYARTILNSGQALLTLLNDILDLSKVEAGKLELKSIIFEPARLIAETANLFAEPAHEKGLSMETAWSGPGQARYRGDPNRLRQMLSNFVNNAIKFTFRGAIRIEARELESREGRAVLEFAVIDQGIGIPGDKRDILFRPFSQVDASDTRQFGGTGLGLSIVSNLARLMEGETGVDSEEGKGSRFWFRIPVETVESGEDRRISPRQGIPDDLAGRRILLVEDDPINRQVLKAMLQKKGMAVDTVESGQEAVEALARSPAPDLVLMDCQMPVMDGFEATRRIRHQEQEEGRPRLPIIALTAGAFEEDRHRCLAAGMDDFVTKPLGLADLSAVLARWAERRPAPAEVLHPIQGSLAD